MRHLKLVFVALAICVTTSSYATPVLATGDGVEPTVSLEIEKMLTNSELIVEDEFQVTIVFMVTVEKRIEIRSISSPNDEVNRFLQKRLQNKKLHGNGWFTEKIYELPVKVKAMR